MKPRATRFALIVTWLAIVTCPWLARAQEEDAPTEPEAPMDIVGCWSFEEGKGGQSVSKETKAPIRLLGTTWIRGHSGHGIYLDGQVAYLDLPEIDQAKLLPGFGAGSPTSFSFAMRIWMIETANANPLVVKQGNLTRGYMFSVERGGRLSLQVTSPQGRRTYLAAPGTLEPRRWYHVAVTYHLQNNQLADIRLYLDGAEVAATKQGVGPPAINELPFHIGRLQWNSAYTRYFGGRLDDLCIYTRALTPDEIADLAKTAR